ncbi:MAG: metal ABC transporter permease [Thermoprotei archaeon]|nr:MAG: metal ABC transporter permease [Thermoprotei archaeon]
MIFKKILVTALVLTLIVEAIILAEISELKWVLVLMAAATAYGFLSSIIAARRLYFLASASPHSALLAVVLAIPLARVLGFGDEYFWAVIIGTCLVYTIGYAIHRGIDPDTATATFVAFTASLSVVAIYFVLTSFPVETNIMDIIIGDPLLAEWSDAFYATAVATITALSVLITYREQICLGIDRDSVRLSGIRTAFYDALVFTLLALATVALIKIVGFVLEHVLLLLPAAISSTTAVSSRESVFISVVSSIAASLVGLYFSIIANLSPAGVTGLVLMVIYVLALVARRKRG